ncbi:MAG: histidine triad nucleotide-binding protein [Armatimonadota bacterium]
MDSCIFCKIADHEIPANIAYEDDYIIAFHDLNPAAPTHILVIPKKHIPGIMSLTDEDNELIGRIMQVVKTLAQTEGIADEGFRVVVNYGENAGQSVGHIHFHLLGGRQLKWPPG